MLNPCQGNGPAHENASAGANDLVDLCKFVFHRFSQEAGFIARKKSSGGRIILLH